MTTPEFETDKPAQADTQAEAGQAEGGERRKRVSRSPYNKSRGKPRAEKSASGESDVSAGATDIAATGSSDQAVEGTVQAEGEGSSHSGRPPRQGQGRNGPRAQRGKPQRGDRRDRGERQDRPQGGSQEQK
ncbi:MAG: hypothetical protein RIR50_1272, partial [Pseudomonadota bacterium]